MTEFLSEIQYWHWWIIAIVCLIVEMLAPGAVFIWFSIAAGIVGVTMLVFVDMPWQLQLMLFSVLSVLSIVAWQAYRKKNPEASNNYPTLNKRGEELVGRTFTLSEPIVNNYGKINVDDTMWKIRGENTEAGQSVKVVDIDGTVLVVKNT